ncbi:MAG TPA: glycosyltransferase [candidate division Zixibacteria bacterium]|nr:glycosyltransferase [candidate division Zixibacteria bacterium]
MVAEPRDLVVIPYHSWSKVQAEGARTRDAHLIVHLSELPNVRRIMIINRPVTAAECLVRTGAGRTKGEVIKKKVCRGVVRLNERTVALDYFSCDLLGPLLLRKSWFARAFGRRPFVSFVIEALAAEGFVDYDCISFNLFAAPLVRHLKCRRCLFDGWDNFLEFPEHNSHSCRLHDCYADWADMRVAWTTNSESNRDFYCSEFGLDKCEVVRNGVDVERFRKRYAAPEKLVDLPRPLVGIGAKVTHLIDTDLINYLTTAFPEVSFVLAGQILDAGQFHRIVQRPNFHYLGDIHYRDYPAFVQQFDVCLIPYVPEERQHGGDSIKFYEYLAADKPIVSTRMAGIDDSYEGVFTAQDKESFEAALRRALKIRPQPRMIPDELTWRARAEAIWRVLSSR